MIDLKTVEDAMAWAIEDRKRAFAEVGTVDRGYELETYKFHVLNRLKVIMGDGDAGYKE